LDGEEFSDFPAAPDVKRRLSAHAVRIFREHIDESGVDPAVRQETACLYGAIALLHSHQGDSDNARAAFAKATAIWEALIIDSPDNPALWQQLGHNHFYLAEECDRLGLLNQAAVERRRSVDAFLQALRLDPQDVATCNNAAWHLANTREPSVRDPARAVELAGNAVALAPVKWQTWNTLGVAHYRSRDWRAAIDSLKKSLSLPNGDDALNHYFLAMAHWQLGEKVEALRRYHEAARWVKANPQAQGGELRQIDAEASQLLGTKESLAPKGK
jgi:tetratricopeptide (TPR) repeat protein